MSEPISDEVKAAFLESLSKSANVSAACEVAGLIRRTAYYLRDNNKEFRKAWDAAQELGTQSLEDEGVRRAHEGTLRPVFYKGDECGQIREYSDTLLIFMLKARKPEKYKDRVEQTGRLDVTTNGESIGGKRGPSPEAIAAARALVVQSGRANHEGGGVHGNGNGKPVDT